jgi:alpha,alpha-trehalase
MPRPIERRDGYLPIEDHALIGDGETCALVGRDAAVSWLCLPRFDSPATFAGLLDRQRGGSLSVQPTSWAESTQRYLGDTGVLETELHGASGVLRVTDALALDPGVSLREGTRASQQRLVRRVEALSGDIEVEVDITPRGEWQVQPADGALHLAAYGRPDLQVAASQPLDGLRTTLTVEQGRPLDLVLDWSPEPMGAECVAEALRITRVGWEDWLRRVTYRGPHQDMVRRSAVTLKMLDHFAGGAIIAAATSSLPEWIGGERNWDYRYAWIRDAAFSVYALRRISLEDEADAFLRWVLDIVEHGQRPELMYDLDGGVPPQEVIDEGLEGYRGSAPVRWGNAAAEQDQRDVFGEMLDCAYQWVRRGGRFDPRTWEHLAEYARKASELWREPDHGIWEVRTEGEVWTYSAAMCQVALDRAAKMARRLHLPGDADAWQAEADRICDAILEEAWNPEIGALTAMFGGEALDASVLSLPLRRVLPVDHPKMTATTDAIAERLGAGHGLIHRYDTDELDDGLEGPEGAFLLCSFWLVDNLALQGRVEEAEELYADLCDRANHVGLLPEQIEPETGHFLGNFPQAFSHVGIISSAVTIERVKEAIAAGQPASLAGTRATQDPGDADHDG